MTALRSGSGSLPTAGSPPPSLAVVKPARARAVGALRRAATEFAVAHGAGPRLRDDVALAVSEATSNAVRHADVTAGESIVELTATVADRWLDVRVRDRGEGFGARQSDGLGLGLTIIASVSVYLTICQEGHGTEVRMRFPLPR